MINSLTKSITLGTFPRVNPLSVRLIEPSWGFDEAAVNIDVADSDWKSEMDSAGYTIGAQFSGEGMPSGSLMYIDARTPQRNGDGTWSVGLSLRGSLEEFPGGGCRKFARLPHASGIEEFTVGGPNTTFTMANEIGETVKSFSAGSVIRFTQPKVSFEDVYLANINCYDPNDPNKRNLRNVGMGTQYPADGHDGAGGSDVEAFDGFAALKDWHLVHEEVPVSVGENVPFPDPRYLIMWGSVVGAITYNFNYGYVLVERYAERVTEGIDMWFIRDTLVWFDKYTFN